MFKKYYKRFMTVCIMYMGLKDYIELEKTLTLP